MLFAGIFLGLVGVIWALVCGLALFGGRGPLMAQESEWLIMFQAIAGLVSGVILICTGVIVSAIAELSARGSRH